MWAPKVELIARSRTENIPLISALGGMGNKLDPTRIVITDIAKTHTCPLARAVRVSLRKKGIDGGVSPVVFSPEPAKTAGGSVPGSTAFVPPAAGLIMASWIVKRICGGGGGGLKVDLFEQSSLKQKYAPPLALRMRPESLEEFVGGQEHILAEGGKLLRSAIKQDILRSIILYGPPGVGKTTLAYVISRTTKGVFIDVSATTTGGVVELKKIDG